MDGFGRFAEIYAVLGLELFGHMVEDAVVPVDAAEMHVAVGGQHLEMGRRVAHHGHVERTSAQVEDQRQARFEIIRAARSQLTAMPGVCQRGGGGLVDDVDYIEARNTAGVLCGLAPRVVEIVGYGDHGVADLPDAFLGVLAELFQDQGRKKLGRNLLAVESAVEVRVAHPSLDAFDHVAGVFHRRAHAVRTDHHMMAVGKKNQTGRLDLLVLVGHGNRSTFLVELGNCGKSGPQIYANRLSVFEFHLQIPYSLR